MLIHQSSCEELNGIFCLGVFVVQSLCYFTDYYLLTSLLYQEGWDINLKRFWEVCRFTFIFISGQLKDVFPQSPQLNTNQILNKCQHVVENETKLAFCKNLLFHFFTTNSFTNRIFINKIRLGSYVATLSASWCIGLL